MKCFIFELYSSIHMKNIILFFFSIFLLYSGNATAQHTHFNNLLRKNGLSSNKITVISQDSYGYMWFGTKKGLNRFDGVHIDNYLPIANDSTSLAGYYVRDILFTSTRKLIAIDEIGINVFNYKNENFKRIAKKEGTRIILENKNQDIFISLYNNDILVYDQDLNYKKTIDLEKILSKNLKTSITIGQLTKYDDDNFIFTVKTKGFFTFNINTNKISLLSNNYLSDIFVSKIVPMSSSEFWVATSNGIYIFINGKISRQINKDSPVHPLNSNLVIDIQIMKNNEIWIFTYGGGINIYNRLSKEISYIKQNKKDEFAIGSNFLSTTFIDRNATLWIGNANEGVSHLITDNPFKSYKLLLNDQLGQTSVPVSALFLDANKRIWIGSDGNGLYQLDKKVVKHISANENIKKISSINEISPGKLLVGTFNNGLSIFNVKENTVEHNLSLNQIFKIGSPINVLGKDKNNHLWIGSGRTAKIETFSGNHLLNSYSLIDPVKIEMLSMYPISNDSILYGGFEGLYCYSNQTSKLISKSPTLIYSIVKFKANEYWLATDKGLCLIDIVSKKTKYFDGRQGLNDVNVKSLLKGDSNNLWLATPEGISKFNIKKQSFINFTYKDGFVDNAFSESVKLKDDAGVLYFGGYNGLLEFDPKRIHKQRSVNKVLFNKITINHKDKLDEKDQVSEEYIADVQKIVLRSDQKIFTIFYSSFDYYFPEKIKFLYKLDGFNKSYKITSDRSLTFMNLPPGEYNLKIKASNTSGIWTKDYSSLKIVILPAWWQTFWFRLFCVVLLIVILFTINKIILERRELKRKFEFEKKIFEKQKDIDEQQLNFFTNLSHEIRTPLSLILSPLEEIIKNKQTEEPHKLQLILKNALRIKKLINRGIDFRKSQFKEPQIKAGYDDIVSFLKELATDFDNLIDVKKLSLTFESDVEELYMWFDAYMIETIFYNLLSNAIKYSEDEGKIILKLVVEGEHVIIKVIDYGKGIDVQEQETIFERFYQAKGHLEGSGIGLALVKRFVEAHKGEINVVSELGKGSCFAVKLLLGDSHFKPENKLLVEDITSDVFVDKEQLLNNGLSNTSESNTLVLLPNKTILLVEDQTDLLAYLNNSLSAIYNILTASNGKEALKIIEKNSVDLVISDVMMPVMNGYELCDAIKNNSETNTIPVILLTAKTMSADKIEGYIAGADAYIEKPFNLDVVKARIQNLLEVKQRQYSKLLEILDINQETDKIDSKDEMFYNRVINILEKHIGNPNFDIPLFVEEIGMSKSVIYKRMSKITDIGVNDLMLKMRLKKASLLLTHSSKSIAEIATIVGFHNTPYFSTSFKKQFSQSPSDFRKDRLSV